MKKEVTVYRSSGIGFPGALFIVFLVLKLAGTIDWSWWWVTAPLWGGVVFALALLAAIGVSCAVLLWEKLSK